MTRFAAPMLIALSLAGCALLPGGSTDRAPPTRSSAGPRPVDSARVAGVCEARLAQAGANFSALPNRFPDTGCNLVGAVQLGDLPSDSGRMGLANIGPVTCDVSEVFAGWARFGADRAARQILGSPIRSVETFGSYSCRNVAGTNRRSGHATGQAIDISGFVLADGRRVTVKQGWDGRSETERRFLRSVFQSACRRFATVLGPDYNAAHRDHFHLEGVASGRPYCR